MTRVGRSTRALLRLVRGIIVGLGIALLLAGALMALFGKGVIDAAAARWLSDLLQADIHYDDIRVSFTTGVEIKGLYVAGWPTEGSSVTAARLVIRPEWRDLAGGTLRFRSISVSGWTAVLAPGALHRRRATPGDERVPTLEVVDLALNNGSMLMSVGKSLIPLRVAEVEALIRLGGPESSIRIRSAHVSIHDRIDVRGHASLWRLALGPWDAQITIATTAGMFSGTASEAEGGWTWDVAADSVDLSVWSSLVASLADSLGGIAHIEASGQGLDARGRVDISRLQWGSLRVDEVGTGFQARPGAFVARRFLLRHDGGQLAGSGRLVRQDAGWWVETSLRADSIGIIPPGSLGGVVVVSGELEAEGGLAGASRGLTATLSSGHLAWKSWRLGSVDARVGWQDGVATVHELTVAEGTLRGSAHGCMSATAVRLWHDFQGSIGPLLAPFTGGEFLAGDARMKGSLSGSFPDFGWAGTLTMNAVRIRNVELSSGSFAGSAGLRGGEWHAEGIASLGRLCRGEEVLLLAGRIVLEASKEAVVASEATFLRPGGVLVGGNGEWRGRSGRIAHLMALSDRWAVALIGGAAIEREGGTLRLPQLRLAMSGGGLVDASDIAWAPGHLGGVVLMRHIPMGVAAHLGGIPGSFTGRGYGVIHAGATVRGLASVKELRRLPVMADFPVDIELCISRDPRETIVHSLEITHADLRITGHGRIDSTGVLLAEAETQQSPLGKVLILSDELLHAGLRPIFDARSGTISARMAVSGSLSKPVLTGSMAVDGGAEIIVKPIRTAFRSVQGLGRLEGHSIIIDDVQGLSGKGHAGLKGRLDLPGLILDSASFDITGRMQEFRILRGIYGIYDADITLAKRGMGIALDGEARLIEGLIDLPSIPIEPAPPSASGRDDRWFINIVADRGVWVRDRFLNAEVAGHVVVAKEHGIISMQGDFDVLRGTYLYLGRKFTLQEGRVSFLGGPLIIPELNVTATTTVRADRRDGSDITLTLTVTGKVDDPVLRVSADEEGYSEEQIKTMLLFNLTPDDVLALWQGDAFAKEAAGAVEEFLAGELVRMLRAEAGLDELEVSPNLLSAEDRDVHVRLGKYLTPELFVSVASGLRSMGFDEVRIEYLLRTLARQLGLGDTIDLKLVGERMQDVYSRTNYQVQLKLKYKF
ncbi:translocation/assembly module TamB domain-containing protein [Candidatus Fermentibacteria bacterium]|nr:translocation/assembly module TamB domain-containing protein [Candidatus Fermentibacteria bacterium]